MYNTPFVKIRFPRALAHKVHTLLDMHTLENDTKGFYISVAQDIADETIHDLGAKGFICSWYGDHWSIQ